jgi:choloylglycine hydrolase
MKISNKKSDNISYTKKIPIFVVISFMMLLLSNNYSLACTGFTYSEGEQVLVGSNEDWNDYDFWIRFLVAEKDTYGRLIFENNWPIPPDPNWRCPQAGMNDQGLFYDCFATPYLLPVNSSSKPHYYNSSDHYKYSLESYCLSVCSTIEEVLDVYDSYNLEHMERYQVLWVDKTGASIIIEGDDIVFKQGDYQVVTNFIQTHPELGGYPCWRYNTAVDMLDIMNDLTVEYFTAICNATHQTGTYPSVYSGVYDLIEEILYLYYFYNYDNVVVIDLNEELLMGEHIYFLADLFESFNQPPDKPNTPIGPVSGKIGEKFTYKSQATDPDNDQLNYIFDWGDGTNSGWQGPVNSGDNFEASHRWITQGSYNIKVKARDTKGLESEWSDPIAVIIPRNRESILNFNLLEWIIERFPNMFPIIRYLFGQ